MGRITRRPGVSRHAEAEFADWALRVDGLVNRPSEFSLAQLRAMEAGPRSPAMIASRAGALSESGPVCR